MLTHLKRDKENNGKQSEGITTVEKPILWGDNQRTANKIGIKNKIQFNLKQNNGYQNKDQGK